MTAKINVKADRCTGCRLCSSVCALYNEGVNNPTKARIYVNIDWRYRLNAPIVCHQCTQAPCAHACSVSAISRNDGIVKIDYGKCIGCGLCAAACPFGAIIELADKVVKCEMCGGEPQCVKFCETRALELVGDRGEQTRWSRGSATIDKLRAKVDQMGEV